MPDGSPSYLLNDCFDVILSRELATGTIFYSLMGILKDVPVYTPLVVRWLTSSSTKKYKPYCDRFVQRQLTFIVGDDKVSWPECSLPHCRKRKTKKSRNLHVIKLYGKWKDCTRYRNYEKIPLKSLKTEFWTRCRLTQFTQCSTVCPVTGFAW